MSLPLTQSHCSVESETSGALDGTMKYCELGAGSLRRKFDRAVVPELWKELWIGVFWGIEPTYRFDCNQTNFYVHDPSPGYNSIFCLGLNHSSGSLPRDAIKGGSDFCSQSIYAQYDIGTSGLNWYTSSNGSQSFELGTFSTMTVNNVNKGTAGVTRWLISAFDGPIPSVL